MTPKLKSLYKRLGALRALQTTQEAPVLKSIHSEWSRVFGKDKELHASISQLESVADYGIDDCGIYCWVRFYTKDRYVEETAWSALYDYLSELGLELDLQNDALKSYLGGCIIINDDGDVLDTDSQKWIISRKDYESDEERHALIEAWMERTGYFPGVFREDRHGNVFPVSTQAPKAEESA